MKMSELRKALKSNEINVFVDFTCGKSGSVYSNDFSGMSIEGAYDFLVKKEIFVCASAFNQDRDAGVMICDAFNHIKLLNREFGFQIFKAYSVKIGCDFQFDDEGYMMSNDHNEKMSEQYFENHDVNVLYSVIVDKCAELGYTATFSEEISFMSKDGSVTVSKFELQSVRENELLNAMFANVEKTDVVKRRRM